MTPEEAIEIIGSNGLCNAGVTWGDYLKAVQLGREALKRLKHLRLYQDSDISTLLPGETEE